MAPKEKQIRKYNKLTNQNNISSQFTTHAHKDKDKLVINLSKLQLIKTQLSVLELRLNLAVIPQKIPRYDIIAGAEDLAKDESEDPNLTYRTHQQLHKRFGTLCWGIKRMEIKRVWYYGQLWCEEPVSASQLMMYWSYWWKDYSLIRHWKIGQLWILPVSAISESSAFILPTLPSRDGQVYQQWKCTAMAFPLPPVVANIFMEDFETTALATADYSPTIWKQDTFVIWWDKLETFLSHINSLHDNIFTMEIKKEKKIAFLDVWICRNSNNSLETLSPHTQTNT